MRHGMFVLGLSAAALILSGCASATAPSKPAEPAPAMAAKPAEPANPVMAPKPAVLDKTPIKADVSKIKFTAENQDLFGYDDGESRAFYYTNGLGEVTLKVPADGDYEIVVTASCTAAKGENAKFKLKVDGAQVGSETQLKGEDAKDYLFTASLKAGDRKVGAEFTNDMYKEGEYDLNFYLNGLRAVRVK